MEEQVYTEEEVWKLLVENINIFLDWFKLVLTEPEMAKNNKPDLLKWFETVKKK